jgi:DNA-binding transcriptional LysR family regulator
VYRHAREVRRSTDETLSIVRSLETGQAGSVMVGANMAPGTYYLPTRLTAFKRTHPATEVQLVMSDSATIYDQTQKGENDFAVVVALQPPAGLQAETLSLEPMLVMASPDHPLVGAGPLPFKRLAEEPFVCSPLGNGRPQLIEEHFRRLGLARRIEMTLGHPEGIKQAVRDGVGIALLFRFSVERELAAGELVELPTVEPRFTTPLFVLSNLRKRLSPVQLRLLDHLRAASRQEAALVEALY